MIPDRIAALVALLEADSDTHSLTSGRIYGGELHRDLTKDMPETAIVVRNAGGLGTFGNAYQNYHDSRVDVFCYGATPKRASDLYLTVFPVLKQLERGIFAGCMLHWAKQSAGPMPMRDADAQWPYTWSSWQIMASEVAV